MATRRETVLQEALLDSYPSPIVVFSERCYSTEGKVRTTDRAAKPQVNTGRKRRSRSGRKSASGPAGSPSSGLYSDDLYDAHDANEVYDPHAADDLYDPHAADDSYDSHDADLISSEYFSRL